MRTLPSLRLPIAAALLATLTLTVASRLPARQTPPSVAPMADAATRFLASLSPELKAKAAFAFDDGHRAKWYFTPVQTKKESTRKGVRLDKLSPAQKALALDLLRTGLSAKGYDQATAIMANEQHLHDDEGGHGANTRDPDWYFVSVFGEPSKSTKWGWRFEGHHLSVNLTLDNGAVVAATPLLFGTNPATGTKGPRQGVRIVPEVEDPARELIKSLTPEQEKLARQAKQFPEILEGRPDSGIKEAVGVPSSQLTDAQKKLFAQLVAAYVDRLPADLAAREAKKVADAKPEGVFFAYCREDDKKGKPYSYRVQGPTFVIEFVCTQADALGNPANHVHSVYRQLPMDLGFEAK